MMGEDQENKHVCKFCKKSFPCGRSLGGHMRSHMINTSTNKAKEKLKKKKKVSSSSFVNGDDNKNTYMEEEEEEKDFEANGQVGYVLRENPKKSWRFSDSSDGTLNHSGKVCKECGKGFQSWKALFGHMRCHSDRDKVLSNSLEDESWTSENQKLIMDSQSDNEASAPRRRRRSRRRRYKITTTTTNTDTTSSSSLCLVNASTSVVSEIEQEQEEVALCLMMLSRDVGYWGGLNSVADFSDNDSVVLEVRSSGLVNGKQVLDGEKIVKMKKPRAKKKLQSVVSESKNIRFEVRKSALGFKKQAESEVSVHGYFGHVDSSKRPKHDFEVGLEVFEAEKNRVKYSGSDQLIKDLIKEDQADSVYDKYKSSRRTKDDAYNSSTKMSKRKFDGLDSGIGKSYRKKPKFECTTCNKTFHSYQALGGHRASHKKIKGCSLLKPESSENNSIDTDVKSIKSCSNENPIEKEGEVVLVETSSVSKNNKHECPFCFRVFSSGQALGGHKRSHVIESSEVRVINESIAVEQKLPEIQDLLDLNLPAPIEEDMKDDHIGFKPWWVGTNINHEPPPAPVGMISH